MRTTVFTLIASIAIAGSANAQSAESVRGLGSLMAVAELCGMRLGPQANIMRDLLTPSAENNANLALGYTTVSRGLTRRAGEIGLNAACGEAHGALIRSGAGDMLR